MEKNYSEILDSIVARIISSSNPSKVILFGSAARGNMTENSDFDLLVVMKNGIHRRRTAQQIYRNISDIGFASDILVVTEDDIELYREDEANIINPALKEGKVLYAS
ncbi:MAG TPA: nucleotidyltransferase domain-containing protein [Ignavibacteriales bacterium]|nr:nucleotidyltransferase domain-containing protein [Ignavibacteriales bacterium]